jgi:hypothetical protein
MLRLPYVRNGLARGRDVEGAGLSDLFELVLSMLQIRRFGVHFQLFALQKDTMPGSKDRRYRSCQLR